VIHETCESASVVTGQGERGEKCLLTAVISAMLSIAPVEVEPIVATD